MSSFKPSAITHIFLYVAAIIMVGCSAQNQEAQQSTPVILANVEGAKITEFMLQRETQFGVDKAVDPKQILQWKINEHLIANFVRKAGKTQSAEFIEAAKAFKHEALVEEVFMQKVSNQLVVSDEEIKAEIQKRYVSFAFRFYPVKNQKDGLKKQQIWKEHGYDSLLKTYKIPDQEVATTSSRWQSPLVEAYDIDAELLAIIQELPIGSPSAPVLYNGQWMLFEVTDIRRKPIGDWEYNDQWESAKKVVWNRKALAEGTSFVGETMQPLEVKTNRKLFQELADALYPLMLKERPIRSLSYQSQNNDEYKKGLNPLLQNGESVLSSWKGGELRVGDFLSDWTPGLYPLRFSNKDEFSAALNEAVALLIRDKVLLKMVDKGLEIPSDSLQNEIRLREDKWLFQHEKNARMARILSDTASLAKWYAAKTEARGINAKDFHKIGKEAKLRLAQRFVAEEVANLADSLKNESSSVVYEDNLQQFMSKFTEANKLINQNKTVHLFKNYANRPAWPSIDPIWFSLPSNYL